MHTHCVPKKHYYHIDLLRFLFSVLIVYYHLLHSNIMPYVTDPMYTNLAALNNYSENIVVCFFVLGGVFLYRSWKSDPNRTVFEYLVSRVVRLWPVLMVSMLLEGIFSGNLNWNRTLINAFFLQCSGLSLEYRGILWYVSAFFFASMFLYTLLRTLPHRKALFAISIASYFSCVFLINYFGGQIGNRETVMYLLNTGLLRGVGFMGIGILLDAVLDSLSEMFAVAPLTFPARIILSLVTVLTEALCLCFLVRYFLRSPAVGNHFVLVLVFCLLLACLLSRNDPLGFLLNRRQIGYPGRYAYSIYAAQGASFVLLKKTLWTSKFFMSRIPLALIGSVLFTLLLGIAVYYLVELPCTGLYHRWLSRYQSAVNTENP